MASIRMDKWLWAARFFKTRAIAARACELGRIQSNGQPAKPARDVRIGDKLKITNDGGEFHVEVLLLSEVRGPASVAQTLYRETEESKEARLKADADRPPIETRPQKDHPVPRERVSHKFTHAAVLNSHSGRPLCPFCGRTCSTLSARCVKHPALPWS